MFNMCRSQFILVLVAWYVEVTHSWDFAVSLGDRLIFYNSDGTKADTVHFESQNVTAIAYDEVHNRMLYVDKQSDNDTICGYYISSKENTCFLKTDGRNIHNIAYDPATEKFFFTDTNKKSISWISLKPGLNTNVYDLFEMDDRTPRDIAVDSCRGKIYWSNGNNMERARLDGSGREAVRYTHSYSEVSNLAVDTQKIKIYCMFGKSFGFLSSADLDGSNELILKASAMSERKEMTVSKDYIYWLNSTNGIYDSVSQFLKNPGSVKTKKFKEIIKFSDSTNILGLAANYKIDDQIKGIHDCDALSSLLPITEATRTTQAAERYL